MLHIVNKNSIHHSIKSIEDVSRGGRIIDIVLSASSPAQNEWTKRGEPVGLFSWRSFRPTIVNRLIQLFENIERTFPDDTKVDEVLHLLEICSKFDTQSI